jgi:hypothetical protein
VVPAEFVAAAVTVRADALPEPDHLGNKIIPRKIGEIVIHVQPADTFEPRLDSSQIRPKSAIGLRITEHRHLMAATEARWTSMTH